MMILTKKLNAFGNEFGSKLIASFIGFQLPEIVAHSLISFS